MKLLKDLLILAVTVLVLLFALAIGTGTLPVVVKFLLGG